MCAIVLPTVNIGHQGSVAQWELFFQLQLHECCLMASSCSSTELNVWWPRTLSICLFVCSSFRSRLEALFSGNSIIRSCSKKTCKYRNKVTDFIEITRGMDANKVLDFVLLVHLWMPRGLASVGFLYYNGHPWHFSLQRIPNTPFSTINDLLTRRKFYCCNKVIFILL